MYFTLKFITFHWVSTQHKLLQHCHKSLTLYSQGPCWVHTSTIQFCSARVLDSMSCTDSTSNREGAYEICISCTTQCNIMTSLRQCVVTRIRHDDSIVSEPCDSEHVSRIARSITCYIHSAGEVNSIHRSECYCRWDTTQVHTCNGGCGKVTLSEWLKHW